MKEYIKPELIEINFSSEAITVDCFQGTSSYDQDVNEP